MTDYRVAAFSSRLHHEIGGVPEGKQHAYLEGAEVTVCGFGLIGMRRFSQLRFSDSALSTRCSMCDRIVRAAAR